MSAIVVAPISEEFFFRGYMLGRLKTENSTYIRVVESVFFISILFLLSHIFVPDVGIKDFVFYFPLLGAMLGITYWIVGSIIPAITIHTAWNLFFSTTAETHFSINFWFWIILIFLPNFLLVAEHFLRKNLIDNRF